MADSNVLFDKLHFVKSRNSLTWINPFDVFNENDAPRAAPSHSTQCVRKSLVYRRGNKPIWSLFGALTGTSEESTNNSPSSTGSRQFEASITLVSKKYWQADSSCRFCGQCALNFNILRRRHHCRVCGNIFCFACTSLIDWPFGYFDRTTNKHYMKGFRACKRCENMIEAERTSVEQGRVSVKFDKNDYNFSIPGNSNPSNQGPRLSVVPTRIEKNVNDDTDEASTSLYPFSPPDYDPYKIASKKNSLDARNESFADIYIQKEYLDTFDRDYGTRLSDIARIISEPSSVLTFPLAKSRSLQGISGDLSNLVLNKSTTSLNIQHLSNVSKLAKGEAIPMSSDSMYLVFVRKLLDQFLTKYNCNTEWTEIIMPMINKIAETLEPDLQDDTDTRIEKFLKVKSLIGKKPINSYLFSGVVFTQKAALKNMGCNFLNPSLMIVNFSLDFFQSNTSLQSLKPYIIQEEYFIMRVVHRISMFKPQVIMLQHKAPYKALQLLQQNKITVIHGLKPSLCKLISRYTGAEIIDSVDKLALNPIVGYCSNFSIKTVKDESSKRGMKTHVYISGGRDEIAQTVILYGKDQQDLRNVKFITYLTSTVLYNIKLENVLIRDHFANQVDKDEIGESISFENLDLKLDIEGFLNEIHTWTPLVKLKPPFLVQEVIECYNELKTIKEKPLLNEKIQCAKTKEINNRLTLLKKQANYFLFVNNQLLKNFISTGICVLYSIINIKTSIPCKGPDEIVLEFFQEFDCSLGQFIEDMYTTSQNLCTASLCNRPLSEHYRGYIHGGSRVSILIEDFPCPLKGMEDMILTWSYCQICKKNTPVLAISDSTWRYSFSRYLELFFCCDQLKCRAKDCQHDIFKNQVRYFGIKGKAIRMHYDSMELYALQTPQIAMKWNELESIKAQNSEFELLTQRTNQFYNSLHSCVKNRINSSLSNKDAMLEEIVITQTKFLEDVRLLLKNDDQSRITLFNKSYIELLKQIYYWDQILHTPKEDLEQKGTDIPKLQLLFNAFELYQPEVDSENLESNNNHSLEDKPSIFKTIQNYFSERHQEQEEISYPILFTEHIFLDSHIILREDEPSSLIALTLSFSDHKEKIEAIFQDLDSNLDSFSKYEVVLLKPTGTHYQYHFSDENLKVSCKIYFADQFYSLRKACECENHFIDSLSRCAIHNFMGGKSGALFWKTVDDRFLLKQISKQEMQSLLDFAPLYFKYISQAIFHNLPTVLSKIVGLYEIELRNTASGKYFKANIIITENLFYGVTTNRIFDLKGSMRNRHIQSTGSQSEVLLDQNLVDLMYENPLFVREHSKRLLRASLWNDTLFLSKVNVMDYSLLVGVDDRHKILHVGIVDYVRSYTWDKKLESWVKVRGFVGSTGKPTIVSPKLYKKRFREAMEFYFYGSPNPWYQFLVPVRSELIDQPILDDDGNTFAHS